MYGRQKGTKSLKKKEIQSELTIRDTAIVQKIALIHFSVLTNFLYTNSQDLQ